MEKTIRFNDLSSWLKLAIISAWGYAGFFVYAFFEGWFSVV